MTFFYITDSAQKTLFTTFIRWVFLRNNVFNFNQSLNFFLQGKKLMKLKRILFWNLFFAFFSISLIICFCMQKSFSLIMQKKPRQKSILIFLLFIPPSLPDREAQSFGEMSIFSGEDAVILTSGTTVVC